MAKKPNEYRIEGDLTYIILRRSDGSTMETVIDTADLDFALSTGTAWCAYYDQKNGKFYARTLISTSKGKRVGRSLQGLLCGTPRGMHTDHMDGDTLNNRRYNLRVVTPQVNALNRQGANRSSRSGVLGVGWHKQTRKWAATARIDRKTHNIGLFATIPEAAEARKKYLEANTSCLKSSSHMTPSSASAAPTTRSS